MSARAPTQRRAPLPPRGTSPDSGAFGGNRDTGERQSYTADGGTSHRGLRGAVQKALSHAAGQTEATGAERASGQPPYARME